MASEAYCLLCVMSSAIWILCKLAMKTFQNFVLNTISLHGKLRLEIYSSYSYLYLYQFTDLNGGLYFDHGYYTN